MLTPSVGEKSLKNPKPMLKYKLLYKETKKSHTNWCMKRLKYQFIQVMAVEVSIWHLFDIDMLLSNVKP